MKKAVILLSGGLDSATCLALACDAGYVCFALSFDYGQKQRAELHAAALIAQRFKAHHRILEIRALGEIARSALISDAIAIPDDHSSQGGAEIPITYVPARNTVLIALALAYAESLGAGAIFIGASAIDYSGYPDCRPEYFRQYQILIDLATKTGVEGGRIEIHAPLSHLTKAQTIQHGLRLGVDYAVTVTCYRANTAGEGCGSCASCMLRKKGFLEAGVADPTVYFTQR
jgi:7-cyano-7-deazaguanine synthase